MKKLIWFAFAALPALLFAGCSQQHQWYGNERALSATPESPVPGNPEQRTYVAPEAKEMLLGKVFIGPITVKSTRKDGLPEDFTERVAGSAMAGAAAAVKGSERFTGIAATEVEADQILTVEALAHVSLANNKFVPDPVLRDPRSKIIIVYTLKEAKGGKVLVKYSSVENSDWDYTDRAVADLEKLAGSAAQGLMFVLSEM